MAGTLMQFTVGLQIELFALWAKANKDNGGLGWSTDEDWIGAVYSSGGLSTLVFATMCLSKIIEAIGDRSMAVFTSGLSIPLVIALGFAQLIPSKAGCFVYVIIMWILWNAMMSSFLISNSILMNNNIDKRVLGSANGIANGLGAFARAFGPLVAGMIFSWTCSNDVFPINFWLPFLISAIVIVVSNSFVALTTREIN